MLGCRATLVVLDGQCRVLSRLYTLYAIWTTLQAKRENDGQRPQLEVRPTSRGAVWQNMGASGVKVLCSVHQLLGFNYAATQSILDHNCRLARVSPGGERSPCYPVTLTANACCNAPAFACRSCHTVQMLGTCVMRCCTLTSAQQLR
jgi:hypothetical protein